VNRLCLPCRRLRDHSFRVRFGNWELAILLRVQPDSLPGYGDVGQMAVELDPVRSECLVELRVVFRVVAHKEAGCQHKDAEGHRQGQQAACHQALEVDANGKDDEDDERPNGHLRSENRARPTEAGRGVDAQVRDDGGERGQGGAVLVADLLNATTQGGQQEQSKGSDQEDAEPLVHQVA